MKSEPKSTQKPKFPTREEWLQAALKEFTPLFIAKDRKVPAIRVSTGWPSRKALSAKSKSIGECWSPECSEDKITEIFISPFLRDAIEPQGVLSTLLHEMIHAVVGVEHGHKKPFKTLALALGLEGKMTCTYAGEELLETIKEISKTLGAYPHGRLDLKKAGRKSQGTRLIKCTCGEPSCEFTVRMTRKWIDEVGPAHCPLHGAMNFEAAA